MDNSPLNTQLSRDKRYSSEAIQDILQRAMIHQSNDGFTPMQLQEMATELNIEPAILQQAAIEWHFQQLQPDPIEKAPAKSKSKSKALKLSAFLAAALLSAVAVPATVSAVTSTLDARQLLEEQVAFHSSSVYTYDDAAALAKYWNQSVSETKAYIGSKLLGLGPEENLPFLDDYIKEAQTASKDGSTQTEQSTQSSYDKTPQTEQAAFFSSDYTYDDAVALASFWGEPLDETKATIGRKILWGSENVAILNRNLEEARQEA